VAFVNKEMPEVETAYIPDSLFAWYPLYANETSRPPANGNFMLPFPEKHEYWGRLDFSKPYIAIGGGALSSGQPQKSIESYTRLVNAVKGLGLPVYLTVNDFPDSFLEEVAVRTGVGVVPVDAPILMCGAVLAHARLFISGLYHPSIFAALGGTPCIFLQSHAHKMGSLPKVLDYEDRRQFPAFPTDAEISEILSHARFYLKQGEGLRTKIKSAAEKCYQQASSLPAFITKRISAVAHDN
jgi:ADP-heptose:LPS heptosyltransferase